MIARLSVVARAPNSFVSVSALSRCRDEIAGYRERPASSRRRGHASPHEARAEDSDFHDDPPIGFSGQAEQRQLLVRSPHRAVDLRKRRPRVTEELDLHAEWTGKSAPLHGVGTVLKSMCPSPIAGKSRIRPSPRFLLQMAMHQFRQRNPQIGDRGPTRP